MATISIDAGGSTFLPICRDCGWRGLPFGDRAAAMSAARHHELRAHPGEDDALRKAGRYNRRHAARGTR